MLEKDINYLFQVLQAFLEARAECMAMVRSFVARLTKEVSPTGENESATSTKNTGRSFFCRLALFFRVGYRFVMKVPVFFRQRSHLAGVGNAGGTALVIGVSTLRLNTLNETSHIRDNLSYLSKTFPQRSESFDLSQEIQSADRIYICEPTFESPLWRLKEKLWKDGVYVVDGSFLLFVAVVSFPSSLWAVFRSFFACVTDASRMKNLGGGIRSLRNTVAATILWRGYEVTFAGESSFRTFLYTSNSFITEILRWYAIRYAKCSFICELLHGIPTLDLVHYFSKVFETETYRKHFFVSQIPLPLEYGVFRSQLLGSGEFAINPYLNKFPVSEDFIEREFENLIPHWEADGKAIVVCFIGGASHQSNFIESDVFALEKLMLSKVVAYLSKMKQSSVLIYAPHPANPFATLKSLKFFIESDILVYSKTVFTWFISDVSISLISSALFEASYFGGSAFTPARHADGIYPEAILNKVYHPKISDRSFEQLEIALSHAVPQTRGVLKRRALERGVKLKPKEGRMRDLRLPKPCFENELR